MSSTEDGVSEGPTSAGWTTEGHGSRADPNTTNLTPSAHTLSRQHLRPNPDPSLRGHTYRYSVLHLEARLRGRLRGGGSRLREGGREAELDLLPDSRRRPEPKPARPPVRHATKLPKHHPRIGPGSERHDKHHSVDTIKMKTTREERQRKDTRTNKDNVRRPAYNRRRMVAQGECQERVREFQKKDAVLMQPFRQRKTQPTLTPAASLPAAGAASFLVLLPQPDHQLDGLDLGAFVEPLALFQPDPDATGKPMGLTPGGLALSHSASAKYLPTALASVESSTGLGLVVDIFSLSPSYSAASAGRDKSPDSARPTYARTTASSSFVTRAKQAIARSWRR